MKRKGLWMAVLVPVLAAGLWGLWGRNTRPVQRQTRFLMDTYCTIQVPGGVEVRPAIDHALDRMEAIDRRFNALTPDSPLYAFNRNGTPVSDPDLVALVETALDVSRRTDGAFDITVAPLMALWGFYGETPALPDESSIALCRDRVGWSHLAIRNGQLVRLREGVEIDLGGIAKGLAVAEAIQVLKDHDIHSALVDAGGDIYAMGQKYGRPWKVGIRRPDAKGGIIGALDVSDESVVTSGDYERCFEHDGIRYHHILDPKTGYPARGLCSVTVVSPDPVLADAFSTALFVLGPDRALAVARQPPQVEALLVTSDGRLLMSDGLKERFEDRR